jgi:hypothetical protein
MELREYGPLEITVYPNEIGKRHSEIKSHHSLKIYLFLDLKYKLTMESEKCASIYVSSILSVTDPMCDVAEPRKASYTVHLLDEVRYEFSALTATTRVQHAMDKAIQEFITANKVLGKHVHSIGAHFPLFI